MTKSEFVKAFSNLVPHGFEVRVKNSINDLGAPTAEKLGYIYMIPSLTSDSNMYEE